MALLPHNTISGGLGAGTDPLTDFLPKEMKSGAEVSHGPARAPISWRFSGAHLGEPFFPLAPFVLGRISVSLPTALAYSVT